MPMPTSPLFSRFNPRRSLKARIFWNTVSLVTALSLLLSLFVGYVSSNRIKTNRKQSFEQLAYQMADKLERGMFERYKDIQLSSALDMIRQPNYSLASKRTLLEKLQDVYSDYAWIGLTDSQGEVVASTQELLEGKDVSQRPWFELGQNKPYVGDVHEALLLEKLLPNPNDEPLRFVDVAAPVSDSQGDFQGVLCAHLSWEWARDIKRSLLEVMAQPEPIEVFVLSKNGHVLLAPPNFEEEKITIPSIEQTERDRASYFIDTWKDRQEYLNGFAYSEGYQSYPGLGWVVLVRQRTSLALATVRSLQQQVLLVGLSLGSLFAAISWFNSRRISKPIIELSTIASRLSQGGKDFKIPIFKGRDELATLSKSLLYMFSSLNEREQTLKTELKARQQIEVELREQREVLQKIVDGIPVMLAFFDANSEFKWVNREWERVLGWTLTEAKQRNMLAEFYPDPEYRQYVIDFIQTAENTWGEFKTHVRDGRVIDTAWANVKLSDGTSIGIGQDISDRKRREAILKDIASGISVEVGENFFHSLTEYLSKTLKVDFAFVCKLIDPDKDSLQTLAVYGKDEILKNFTYQIANAPCGNAIGRGICICPEAVRQHFPNVPPLEAMAAESYAGMPIFNPIAEVIGLIGIVHTKQFDDLLLIEEVLKIFATRAATEIERQQAEEKIREQAALLDLTHDTILVRNLDNIITFWNLGASEMYGWSAAEALGKKSHELLRTKFSQSLTEIETELFRQDRWSGELIHQKQDGSSVIVMGRWSLLRDDLGNPQQILEINHDITKRKQAEAKIQQQAALLDIATDAIMVRGLDDKILYWNKGAEKMYGWTKTEALNKNGYELLYREYPTELSKTQQAVIENGEWQGELIQVTKAGKDITIQSRWSLVTDKAGNPSSYLVVKSDITEQKQLEKQFLRTQRLESLGTLAGGIAHDLNNILAPILGFAKLLPLKLANVDKQTLGFFKIMETNAERGTALVKQILTFSRGLEGEKGIVQIRHLINEIAQIINETFPKSIELTLSVPKTLWTVNGDVNQLHQVLMNLCVNARDAMPDGGKLIIEAENFTVDREYARLHLDAAEGNYLCITVADTGVGIPPEIIDRIFEPFFTTKEIGRGTGLGLSTVIGIVKSHGGFIDVVSKTAEKRGTRVSIFVPAADAVNAIAESNKSLTQGNGELILVVDDETPMLEVTKATLETYNYRVLTANNGIEAVAAYANNQDAIALIIMDIMMPGMDGKTAIRTLKQINSQIRVIAVSGLISDREIFNELDGEVITFLSKPYSNEELLKTVHEIVSF